MRISAAGTLLLAAAIASARPLLILNPVSNGDSPAADNAHRHAAPGFAILFAGSAQGLAFATNDINSIGLP